MAKLLPASIIENPLDDNPVLRRIPASKDILPAIFARTRLDFRKADYYRIAEAMEPDEIHPEVMPSEDTESSEGG